MTFGAPSPQIDRRHTVRVNNSHTYRGLLACMVLLFWGVTTLNSVVLAQPGSAPRSESSLPFPEVLTDSPPAPSAPVPSASPSTTAPAPPPVKPEASITDVPDYHLTHVHIDATVGMDRVNLVATVELIINRGEGWHRVPLRLGSAHVTQREYTGVGGESPDVSPRSTDEGLVWLFKGIGRHQMKIHAWVPLKPQASGGQFQLSLPRLPPQFEARVHVTIPDPNAVVRSSKALTVLDVIRREKETVVEASVIGSQLLLNWQTPSVAGETISVVQSWFHLKPAAEHLSLVVEQSFELQHSTADSLLVRLPADFRLLQVSGQHYRSHELVPDRPNWVKVSFANDNIGRLQLRWVLERDFAPSSQSIQIEGFQVEGAIREEGLIRIDEFENLRVVPRPSESPLVHRVGVNQVRSLGSGVPLIAYEYLKQPFRLTLDIQPTVPYFLLDPKLHLHLEPDAMVLTVKSTIRIERGAISELKFLWPDWLRRGWRVQSVSGEGEAIGQIAYDATSQPGVLRLWWPSPMSQDAAIMVVFRRPYSMNIMEETAFRASMQLPVPQASELESTELTVDATDQLSFQVTADDGQPLMVAKPDSTDAAGSTVVPARQVRRYRLEDPAQKLQLQLQSHQRELKAVTEIAVSDTGSQQLSVRQNIEVSVSYGRLRQLELALPAPLMEHIPDWAVTQAITVTYQGQQLPLQNGSAPNFVRVDLGEDRIGTFTIQVDYAFPIPSDTETHDLDLPMIALNNIPYSRAECLIDTLETLQVRSTQTDWEALQTSPSQARWINSLRSGQLATIPLTIGPQLADSSQQYVAQYVQVRTIFSADGNAESWAEFQLDSPPSRVLIQFPAHSIFKENGFLLDGKPLPMSAVSVRSGTHEEVTITLPNRNSNQPRLAVRYRTVLDRPFGLTNRIRLPLPVFPRSVWVDETIWEMQLPEGQHLFTYPDLLPQFRWVRHLLFWYREPTPSYLAERTARSTEEVPPEFRFSSHPFNTFYAFRGFGPVQNIEFQIMNRSLILLLGAGLTLLLGFIFWQVPATRNIFSLIVVSFLFAVASLWYVEPILLLLQPAILGVLLALTATVIDSKKNPRTSDRSTHKSHLSRTSEVAKEESSSRSALTRIYRPASASKPRGSE
ncbi:MAG TPA: hypothetical protein VNQ76_02230 [Planctomicrobium sp.]|nr:hypothetical protein [Planctomicrobium sp.]